MREARLGWARACQVSVEFRVSGGESLALGVVVENRLDVVECFV